MAPAPTRRRSDDPWSTCGSRSGAASVVGGASWLSSGSVCWIAVDWHAGASDRVLGRARRACRCWRTSWSTPTATTMTKPVTNVLQTASMPRKMHTAADHGDDQHADQRAEDRAGAAGERGAADDDRGDDRQEEVGPRVRVDRTAEPDEERHRRARRSRPSARSTSILRPGDRDAGQAGRFRVAADRQGAIAEAGAVQDRWSTTASATRMAVTTGMPPGRSCAQQLEERPVADLARRHDGARVVHDQRQPAGTSTTCRA